MAHTHFELEDDFESPWKDDHDPYDHAKYVGWFGISKVLR